MRFSISAIILTKNVEKNIVDCVRTVFFCDEIIIIDDESEDRTIEITKNLRREKIKIFSRSLEDDFSAQRNFGLSEAKGEWVLFVDADERVTNKLKNEIIYLTRCSDRGQQLNGYFVKRRDFMWGRELKHGETGNIDLLRLAKKDAGRWVGSVHEAWKVKGNVGNLKNPLYHYPHQNIAEFLRKINYYTDLRAKELYEKKIMVKWWSIILYPKIKFLTNYFFKTGFLDGVPGLIHALMMSLHSFLVRSKLWLLWQRKYF